MIWFRYDGEAVGKGRPRYARRGGYVQTYTPKKTKDFEEAIRAELDKCLTDWTEF
jgi:Holliday junction resolvase RusA-like endonuclease